MRHWLFALIVLCGGALGAGDAPAAGVGEARIALIIANDGYAAANLGRLPGTQNDAAAMRAALERANFRVTLLTNLAREPMRQALQAFAASLADQGPLGVGFLYYSGHGIADDPRSGRNYLIPVDAQIARITDLPSQALALDEQLEALELAHARATVIVIDACRNTPVALGRGARGLAPVPARSDTIIAFSTGPGEVAADDGLYARTLAQELAQPGVDIETVFARVQRAVGAQTGRQQVPEYRSRLIEPVVFVAATGAAPQGAGALPPSQPTAPPATNDVGRHPSADQPTFSGNWLTTATFGPLTFRYLMHLRQSGERVSGDYQQIGGSITGQIDGNLQGRTLSYSWRSQDGASGTGDFALTGDGQRFSGNVGFSDVATRGTWEGERQ